MPTPIGHTLAGAAIFELSRPGKRNWPRFALCVTLANLADIDMMLGFGVGLPNLFHRGLTHSLLITLAIGGVGIMYGLACRKKSFLFWGTLFLAAYGSHLLLDWLALDTGPPIGIPLFWPFSEVDFISPVLFFSDVYKGMTNATFFQELFCRHNLVTIAGELIIMGPVYVVALIWNRNFTKQKVLTQ